MDWAIKNMDFPFRESGSWGSYRRQFKSSFPLLMMDLLPRKAHWIRHTFKTCNFSLILRGSGEYVRLGKKWLIEAPCVITQLPGEHLEYGPVSPKEPVTKGTWDELYMMYDAALFPAFREQRLLDPAQPVWHIHNLSAVETRITELLTAASSRSPTHVVDQVDRLCELLIVETHLQPTIPSHSSDAAGVIRQVERELSSLLNQDIDIDELAIRYGLSPATFRRRWGEVVNVPPARYRLQARLREACRLLTETALPIYEIARRVGFPDELYFSRRFHQELTIAPRTYRKTHRLHRKNQKPLERKISEQH